MKDKRKSVDEAEMKRCEEIFKKNEDSVYHDINKFIYENSMTIYNLSQSILKRKVFRISKSRDDYPDKKARKLN